MTDYKNSGSIGWESPSNIALIKYWGKKGNQLPCNPSISMSLKNSLTRTVLSYEPKGNGDQLSFLFEGKRQVSFEQRITKFLGNLSDHFKFLTDYQLSVSSENTFPHSTGIASSASAMSSLALCLCSMEEEISGVKMAEDEFYRKAGFIARLGSGSASRSVYGGFVTWGESNSFSKSSDEYAVPFSKYTHPVFLDFQDAILLVSSKKKEVSSSAGHQLMENHPYASARFAQANKHFERMLGVLRSGDLEEFIEIMENEALSLHGLMMNSTPSFTLLKPNTLELIERIRSYRLSSNVPVGFTLDAGPNIHLLYPKSEKERVVPFIDSELSQFLENGKYIVDEKGEGPQKIKM
ncbi:diphosphomevalonate/mevalonate 3,5-bisphosphate decarboxylase family protein [Labilibaculum euxinus]|uniref:Diphosphomevalonate decarboxylase n=1 Tax=Labilibaculum euxinus TaxID=2686357 RepID=A0A7M4D4P7_9BACT|nr:diphosphomevalonate decarboxylase [Labilibaculum euxinus]MUP37626.1 diphosphomevalonate decarboxylase [Labilibaculum euxinus]MVB06831.1 diphosphomevalonate decarboxylase [Labilibaculum euxinus]